MFFELFKAFFFIFIAEMGDKTQILAMTFATKYKVRFVVLGIFIGSLLNHALAVLLGANLQHIIPLDALGIIAGISFIGFGLWSFKNDDSEAENKTIKYGPVITVAIAFFIGELGDKTQLTATILSSDADYPLFILMGTVTGMVVTGLLGIFIGIKLGNKLDEFFIKIGAGIIFIFFGYIKLIGSIDGNSLVYITLISFVVLILSIVLLKKTIIVRRTTVSKYKMVAQRLNDYYSKMYEEVENICLGKNHCGTCGGNNCLVGYTKNILLKANLKQEFEIDFIEENALKKEFDRVKVLESLIHTLRLLKDDWNNESYKQVHKVRHNFEFILYSISIEAETYEQYIDLLRKIDYKIVEKV